MLCAHQHDTKCRHVLANLRVYRVLQAELAGLMLQQQQQESNIWNNLLQKLPQPQQTTAYMAQRELVMGPVT